MWLVKRLTISKSSKLLGTPWKLSSMDYLSKFKDSFNKLKKEEEDRFT